MQTVTRLLPPCSSPAQESLTWSPSSSSNWEALVRCFWRPVVFSIYNDLYWVVTARLTGIHDLGCIGECMNLERLDLSVNNISNLAPLASLRHLSVLNLSSNKISDLGECFFVFFFPNAMVYLFLQYVLFESFLHLDLSWYNILFFVIWRVLAQLWEYTELKLGRQPYIKVFKIMCSLHA